MRNQPKDFVAPSIMPGDLHNIAAARSRNGASSVLQCMLNTYNADQSGNKGCSCHSITETFSVDEIYED